MIKQDFYIANLIARYLSEEITPEETIKLTAWREESTAHEILFKKICNEENQKQHFRKNTAFNPSSGWKEVEKRIKRNNKLVEVRDQVGPVLGYFYNRIPVNHK